MSEELKPKKFLFKAVVVNKNNGDHETRIFYDDFTYSIPQDDSVYRWGLTERGKVWWHEHTWNVDDHDEYITKVIQQAYENYLAQLVVS